MVSLTGGTFRVVLLTPEARLLDCRCGSLVLPGHDGLVGVLRNHAPMLCRLGLGIMQIRDIPDRQHAFFLIDGGFARVSLNFVTVLAYSVTTFEGMEAADAEELLSKAKAAVVEKAYAHTHLEAVDMKKSAFVVKMAEYCGLADEKQLGVH